MFSIFITVSMILLNHDNYDHLTSLLYRMLHYLDIFSSITNHNMIVTKSCNSKKIFYDKITILYIVVVCSLLRLTLFIVISLLTAHNFDLLFSITNDNSNIIFILVSHVILIHHLFF